MRTLKFKLIAILLVTLSGSAIAQQELKKTFNEKYPVDKNTLFEINNRFGDINIENTKDDNISIYAEIVVKAKSQNKADKSLNEISVTISKSGNTISAITEIDNIKTNNAHFQINYEVNMPAYLNINLTNKYGHVVINELHGKSNLTVKYGSLNINKILDGNEKPLTTIKLGYCENSNIQEFKWGKVGIKYSKLKINEGHALAISSKYSKLRLGNFSSIVADAGYDDYNITTVKNLVLTAKYSNIDVDLLSQKLKLENKYGNISIDEIPDGFKSIDVISKYASIDLGIAKNANYNLEARAQYADIKYNDLKIKQRIKESNSIQIIGTTGNKTTNAYVKVESSYGGIDLRP